MILLETLLPLVGKRLLIRTRSGDEWDTVLVAVTPDEVAIRAPVGGRRAFIATDCVESVLLEAGE